LQTIAGDTFSAAPGNAVDMNALAQWLETNALRALQLCGRRRLCGARGILDLFPPA